MQEGGVPGAPFRRGPSTWTGEEMAHTEEQKARYAANRRADRAANPEKYRARDAARRLDPKRREQRKASDDRNRDRINAYNRAYYAANPQKFRDLVDAWRLEHPERVAAHRAVEKAIRNGELIRPDQCFECNTKCRPDGAHTDYSKPLDVIWLCRQCHMILDKRKIDETETAATS